MSDVTRILSMIESGDQQASEELLPLLYDELRKLAAARMASERSDHTLQATALVHEAYVRLVDTDKTQHWDSRGHFFAAAGEAMRRILVEQARRKQGPTAGGQHQRIELSGLEPIAEGPAVDILALSESLDMLKAKDARAAEVVKLRFFAGLTVEQAADVLGVSVSTAKADWTYAKSWLRAAMCDAT